MQGHLSYVRWMNNPVMAGNLDQNRASWLVVINVIQK
jgi:hypothetical protein